MLATSADFVPPSPGAWELERTHFGRPPSVFLAEFFPDAMRRGFSEGTQFYGVLLDHLELAIINGFVYAAPRPVGAPKSAKGAPPRLLFALLRRLNAPLRNRVKRAEVVLRDRVWRQDLKWWDDEVKPAIVAEARTLASEDLGALSNQALAGSVRRAADFAARTITWHHRFNCCVMLPQGDFLVHATEWTGLPPSDILQMFRGASPVSAGATAELRALRQAFEADPEAMALLHASVPAQATIDALAGRRDAVGAAVRTYLDLVGLRILGSYDVCGQHAREHPELLVKIMRTAATEDERSSAASAAASVARVRDKVPDAHRATFDAMLHEAMLTYRLRDERNMFGDALGAGLARRAILEAGRRLVAAGLAERANHLVDATAAEITSLLEGRGGPSASELAARVAFRTTVSLDSVPQRLGFPPSAPPPAEWFPPAAARIQRATNLMLDLMFSARQEREGQKLKGFAASPGVYEGTARIVGGPADFPALQSGEVLVTTSTSPTFNVILPLLGAIVTERGGALSHAAIVAREYGLPAVVGCVGATAAVTTGMRLRVDGDKGELWILG